MPLAGLLFRVPVLPVLPVLGAGQVPPLARVLRQAGLNVLMVRWSGGRGLETAAHLQSVFPGCLIGMCDIIDAGALREIAGAGLAFAAPAGLTPGLVASSRQHDVPLLPGVSTVTEILIAREAGYRVQMLFPARVAGGVPFLRQLAHCVDDVSFCVLGDLAEREVPEWLALPDVITVAGDWMLPRPALENGDWELVTELCRRSTEMTAGRPGAKP